MFLKCASTPTLCKRRVITSEPQFPNATGYDKDNLSEKKDWSSLYVDELKCSWISAASFIFLLSKTEELLLADKNMDEQDGCILN